MTRRIAPLEFELTKGIWQPSLAGGVEEVPEGYLFGVQNFNIGPGPNQLIHRPGFYNISTGAWPTNQFFDWFMYDGTNGTIPRLIGCSSTTIYQHNLNNNTIATYTCPSTVYWGVQYKSLIYLCHNITNIMYSFNGSANATVIAGSPNAAHLEVHKDRIFAITTASRLAFCDAANPASWPGANILDVNSDDGDSLVATKSLGEKLLVFKKNSTWVLYVTGSPVNWRLTLLNAYIGCDYATSIADYDGWVYFVNYNGAYRTDGTVVEKISDALEATVFENYPQQCFGGIYEDHYMFSTYREPGVIYLYHIPTGTWWKWKEASGYVLGFFTPVFNTNTSTPGYFCVKGSNPGGGFHKLLYRLPKPYNGVTGLQDNGVTPVSYLYTGPKKLNTIDKYSRLSNSALRILVSSGAAPSVQLRHTTDGGTTSGTVVALSTYSTLVRQAIMKLSRMLALGFDITNNTTGQIVIDSLIAEAYFGPIASKRST